MGSRGPAPTPSETKRRRGTYRPDRAPDNEATPALATADQLKAPDWLSELAQEKWNELALRLHSLGLLTELDLDTLSAYCTAWSNWRQADDDIRKHGATTTAESGYQAISPSVTRAKQHLQEVKQFGSLLGLSPSSRTRIEMNPTERPKDDLLV